MVCVPAVLLTKQSRDGPCFDPHYGQIDAKKEEQKQYAQQPSSGRNRKTQPNNEAAQVERIAGIGVRARDRQLIILSHVA